MIPLVSVITPVYNRERYLKETIESVLDQSFEDFEYILVDDCSSDSSVDILKDYAKQDDRIKLILLNENKGPAGSRNEALKDVRGKFLAFLDSDDIWLKDKLKEQVNFMKKGIYPISFTSYSLIDKDGNDKKKVVKARDELNLHEFLKCTCIGFSTSMVNRELTGDFSFSNRTTREDSFLWITLLKKGLKAYGIDFPYVKYRVHEGNISANKIKAAFGTWQMYRLSGFNFFKSFYYFSHYAVNGVLKRI